MPLSAPDRMRYLGAFIRFVTIAYTTLILVPLQMLQCVTISDELVWWFDANVVCYEPPFQKAAIFAVAILCPLPLVCMFVMQRWTADLAPWQQEVVRVLSNGYRDKRRWWLGVSLLRRLLLVVTFVTVQDKTWGSVATTVLCIGNAGFLSLSLHTMLLSVTVYVVLNLRLQPFETPSTHRFETVSVTLLAILAASSGPALAKKQYGTTAGMKHREEFEWVQLVCAVGPIVLYVLLVGYRFVEDRCGAGQKGLEESGQGGGSDRWISFEY